MKLKYKLVRFKAVPQKTNKQGYSCINNNQNSIVGFVGWKSRYNTYYYFPISSTAYSTNHLKDIQTFINQLNKQ